MSSSFLAYFGHINIDVSIRVRSLPRVGSINAENVSENFGGTAGNFAIVSRKLGLDFDLYGAVSSKSHGNYLKYLSSIGVETDHLDISDESYGPVCYITSDGDNQVAYMFQGPMEDWAPVERFNGSSHYQWVHFSTGPPEAYAKIFDRIKESRVTFDPGQEIHFRYDGKTAMKFLERADMFVGNEAEFTKLMELTGESSEAIVSRVHTVIITGGRDGVTAYIDGKKSEFSILPVEKVHDTIGAGDSFRAGLYTGLWKGMSMKDSIVMGIIVSSVAIQNPITRFTMTSEELTESFRSNRGRITGE